MSKLLYHPPENPVAESPFDRAIVELARGQDVKIVSPYISLSYLERIIGLSRSWQLISDVFEWLSATPGRERSAVYEFLKRNEGAVHYYPAIHAKTVISQAAVYTGSANLTDTGVLRRTEFGVLLRDKAQVDEIHQWFSALWAQTSPPPLDRVQELIASLNQLANSPFRGLELRETHLESSALKVRAQLVKLMGEHPVSLAVRQGKPESRAAPVPQPPAVAEASTVSLTPLPKAVGSASASRNPPEFSPQHELFDLEEAVLAYVERNAHAGFTLRDLHSDLALRSAALRVREVYFAIAPHCASLSRSLLELDAVNRLVYREGRFVQSSRSYLEETLAPLDILLEWFFRQLSFAEPRLLPEMAPAHLQPSVPRATYRLLLKELEAADFLRVGRGAQLNPTVTWSARLRLLKRAYTAWCAALANHQLIAAMKPTADSAVSGQREPSPGGAEGGHGAAEIQGVTTSMDAQADEQADRAMEEKRWKLENKRALQQGKILANLDIAFESLAQLYIKHGETVDMSFDALRESVSTLASLSQREAEKVLNGSSSLIHSPFMAVSAASRKAQVKLYPLLEGNRDLLRLPKTKAMLESSKTLMAHARPKRAQRIVPIKEHLSQFSQEDIDEVSMVTAEMADKYYRVLCERIFNASPGYLRNFSARQLLLFIRGQNDSSAKVLPLLIYGYGSEDLRLFRITSSNCALASTYVNLNQFPVTKRYLENFVWRSSKRHHWLPQPTAVERNFLGMQEPNLVLTRAGGDSLSHRDVNTFMFRMVSWIHSKVPSNAKYDNLGLLVEEISQGADIPKSVVSTLTKPAVDETKMALMVKYSRGSLKLELRYRAMRRYPLAMTYLEKYVWIQSPAHKWLTPVDVQLNSINFKSPYSSERAEGKPSADFSTVQPIKLMRPENAMLQALHSAQRKKCDKRFAELLQLAITHGNPLPPDRSTGEDSQVQKQAEAALHEVRELCRQLPEVVHPVITLERPPAKAKHLEVVFNKSFEDDLAFLPLTKALIASPSLMLR